MKPIGEGSIAMVFLAREIKPERLVALKVLKTVFAADVVMRTRFQKEGLAAARIAHPNFATVYRVGERKDGLPYIAQEYIGGMSLADLLRGSEVRTVDESIRIVASVAKALAAADAKQIAHRNVRPDDILIERDSGRVVMTDFGIAEFKGDSRYSSPEHIHGEPTTAASDIFGLGVIANELLPGHAGVPQDVAQILMRCLDKNPSGRPTAEELVQLLPGNEHNEAPLNAMQPTQRAAEASLMRVAVISGLVIMAMGAAAGLWIFVHYSQ